MTVQERRRTVAVLRACGAGSQAVQRLLLGAALAPVVPAAVVGILLERFLFGPALANLAAGYATLPLDASVAEVVATVVGLGLAAPLSPCSGSPARPPASCASVTCARLVSAVTPAARGPSSVRSRERQYVWW